ncbi:hypothetical protein FGO68_gene8 [Halteria grandinella]|uniref:Uncharacterized protein n=1 Tax=Halteria grandinella TaxID=5974 RepID=A0A8J8SVR0_HALGN|nr:hypothetical protein FGO68_gene8 [Halteria grandinella]
MVKGIIFHYDQHYTPHFCDDITQLLTTSSLLHHVHSFPHIHQGIECQTPPVYSEDHSAPLHAALVVASLPGRPSASWRLTYRARHQPLSLSLPTHTRGPSRLHMQDLHSTCSVTVPTTCRSATDHVYITIVRPLPSPTPLPAPPVRGRPELREKNEPIGKGRPHQDWSGPDEQRLTSHQLSGQPRMSRDTYLAQLFAKRLWEL